MSIRQLRQSDVGQVVTLWNICFPHDQVSKKWFEEVIFGDPNFETEGHLVAATENGSVIGFVSAVAREGVEGRNGKGRPHETNLGYIKGLCALREYEKDRLKEQLLRRSLKFLKNKGKKIARVGEYTGRYFFSGIDERYREELQFYKDNGFEEIDATEDVVLDLKNFQPTEYQKLAKKRIEELGITIRPFQPEFLKKMKRFVEKLGYPQWFPVGWETDFGKRPTLIALLEGEVVGWGEYHPHREGGYFGPVAVLDELRGNGIGTCLLLESSLRMKASDTPSIAAGWANTPFYLKNGWKVSRRYITLQKDIMNS